MEWLVAGVIGLVVCFGFVVFFGAPYLPTLTPQVQTALDMVDLRESQVLLELGCGDGKVLVAAAERGLKVVGYELNPLLALVAWVRTRRFGGRVRVICGNFWRTDWPDADAIFVFLLDKYMLKLDTKIAQQYRPRVGHPVQLVSFAFQIPERKPAAVKAGLYLYDYQ